MSRLTELNEARLRAKRTADILGMANVAGRSADERLMMDAEFQLAMDVWYRAELDYRAELQNTSTMSLMSLAGVSSPRTAGGCTPTASTEPQGEPTQGR